MTKSEMKTAVKATLTTAVQGIVGNLIDYGRLEVSIGMHLDSIRGAFADAASAEVSLVGITIDGHKVESDDWREYARTVVPGRSMPTLYRWTNAGRVATIIGETVGNATVGALVPLYRILAETDGSEGETAAAADLVRETWSDLVKACKGKTPSESDSLAAAERVQPTTKGKTAATTAAAETTPETPETTPETTPTAPASAAGLIVVDPAAVESAMVGLAPILADIVRKGTEETTARGIMLAALRLADEHGAAVIVAALSGKTETAAAAPETK